MSATRSSILETSPPEPATGGVTMGNVGLPEIRRLARRFGLTSREAQVARRLAVRRTNSEIARELHVSGHTVRKHTERVLRKMGIHSRRDVYGVISAAFRMD